MQKYDTFIYYCRNCNRFNVDENIDNTIEKIFGRFKPFSSEASGLTLKKISISTFNIDKCALL